MNAGPHAARNQRSAGYYYRHPLLGIIISEFREPSDFNSPNVHWKFNHLLPPTDARKGAKARRRAAVSTPETPHIGVPGRRRPGRRGMPEDPGPRPPRVPGTPGARRGPPRPHRSAPSLRTGPRSLVACRRTPTPVPNPGPRHHGPPFSPRARLALTRSMWENPVSTRFLRSSQPMPPAPTTSTRPPATASASSRGSPRDRAMARRPRAETEAEAGELSCGRKRVGEGRRSFRSCALRPPVGARRGRSGTW